MASTLTSTIRQVELNNPSTETLGYRNNVELVTTESATVPGFQSPIFLANVSSNKNLAQLASLASLALAQAGEATIAYEVETTGTSPSGRPTQNMILTSLTYAGQSVSV